jgi:phosphoribosylglycinamide formyltransferase-1
MVANRDCQAIVRAKVQAIPTLLTKDWDEIDLALTEHRIELIVLAGFLAIIPSWICKKWDKRIINIHPSLLPKFGGKGMYGIHVQEAVLQAQEKEAGCTIHYVSGEVDGGEIIAQATIEVLSNDTPETLSQRVQAEEKKLLPRIIGEFAQRHLS